MSNSILPNTEALRENLSTISQGKAAIASLANEARKRLEREREAEALQAKVDKGVRELGQLALEAVQQGASQDDVDEVVTTVINTIAEVPEAEAPPFIEEPNPVPSPPEIPNAEDPSDEGGSDEDESQDFEEEV